MSSFELAAFALLTGITVCGIAGSVLEMLAARPLSFAEPFFSRRSPARSVVATVLAGPLMLANDALNAHREGAISMAGLCSCGCTALIWALSIGVVFLHLAAKSVAYLLA